eukprot:4970593-Prymnesium_polylepis.1
MQQFNSPKEVLVAVKQAAGVQPLREALKVLVPEAQGQMQEPQPPQPQQAIPPPQAAPLPLSQPGPRDARACFCPLAYRPRSAGGPALNDEFWIQCKRCRTWVHRTCAGVSHVSRTHPALTLHSCPGLLRTALDGRAARCGPRCAPQEDVEQGVYYECPSCFMAAKSGGRRVDEAPRPAAAQPPDMQLERAELQRLPQRPPPHHPAA